MLNEDHNQQKNNSSIIPYRLAKTVGIVYIAFGLFELLNYFYKKPIDVFQVLFYISIGIGMFEKHAWSRVLCIFASGMATLSGVYFFTQGGKVLWNGASVVWGKWYVIAIIIVHSFLLYILLRSDVKNLFSKKEN